MHLKIYLSFGRKKEMLIARPTADAAANSARIYAIVEGNDK